jgi:tetratricopeptide (TPR) repeat protein
VRITAQLINTATGYHLWSESYEREMTDLFTIQDEISRAIVSTLSGSFLGATHIGLSSNGRTSDPQAHDRYLRGLYFLNRGSAEDLRRAGDLFQEALAHDPQYALAYAGLAETYLQHPTLGVEGSRTAIAKAKNAALKAVEIGPMVAEGHIALARVSFTGDWNFAAAERSYNKAVELNLHSTARGRYAFYLVAMGRIDEAIATMRQVVARDPLSVSALNRLALLLYYHHEYDAALEPLQRALLLDPTDYAVHWYFGLVHMQKRMYPEAIRDIRTAVRLSGESPLVLATLGSAYARAGRREEALNIRAQLRQPTNLAYLRPQGMVFLLSDLGEKDAAFRQLEATVADRSMLPHVLTSEPLLDPMRSDPRFTALLKKTGLN